MFTKRSRIPLALKDSPLADRVPRAELEQLDRLGTIVTIGERKDVIRQSEQGRQCLVVLDGTLRVDRDGRHLADLGAGEVAGEMALLTGMPCNASVVADPGTTVYAMNRRELSSLLEECPTMRSHVLRTAFGRIPIPA